MSQTSVPLGGAPKPTARSNRRATVRYRCAPATTGKVYAGVDHEFLRAWIVDLSQRGIGMQLTKPIDLGRHVVIVMRSSDNSKSMEMSARVVRHHELPHNEWHIGCEFTIPLTPEELELFL
ncbi:MAG TPA: PilZ domain-containing protein [Gemmataceae bacterium]|nr:PilZ domain-containing protein [Gemmataceae bacterium]